MIDGWNDFVYVNLATIYFKRVPIYRDKSERLQIICYSCKSLRTLSTLNFGSLNSYWNHKLSWSVQGMTKRTAEMELSSLSCKNMNDLPTKHLLSMNLLMCLIGSQLNFRFGYVKNVGLESVYFLPWRVVDELSRGNLALSRLLQIKYDIVVPSMRKTIFGLIILSDDSYQINFNAVTLNISNNCLDSPSFCNNFNVICLYRCYK